MMRSFLMLFALAAPSLAGAGVLLLANDESTQRLRVYDGTNGSAVAQSSLGLGVQIGSLSADAFGDRVFFVGNGGAQQTLFSLDYGATGGVEQATLPSEWRVSHLEWDGSGAPRLVGIALDATTDAPVLVAFQSGSLASLGMPLADCCTFRAGASAFRASDDSLFVIGRLDGETQERLIRFTLGAVPSASSALIDSDLHVVELAIAPNGDLYGIGRSLGAELTRLVAFDASLQATLRGAGMADCCEIVAGASVVDPDSADLVAIGSATSQVSPNPRRFWRFDLATGAILDTGTAVLAAGLFHDATTIAAGGDLFADGFESGAPLPRPGVSAR